MTADIAMLPATELVALYRRKELSPVEVTRACLDRIDGLNGELNAYLLVDHDAAIRAAEASEARWRRGEPVGLVDGVPTSIKDLILTKGWPTLRGSKIVPADQPWTEDAPAVARLKEHGAVLLGKTTTPEFGHKGVTHGPLTGISRNPRNKDMTAGGSSGGAAIAAATGMGALHIGTDGGGSIRIPAGFTGVFGIKPSYGRVPAYPSSPFAAVAHLGPMTRTVADGALMLRVMSFPDPEMRDWYALPHQDVDYLASLDNGVRGMRIAFAPTFNGFPVDDEIAALVRRAVERLAGEGAEVEEITIDIPDMVDVFRTIWFASAATLVAGFSDAERGQLEPSLAEMAEWGSRVPLVDYTRALGRRGQIGTQLNQIHRRYDLLLTPTLPIPAFTAGLDSPWPIDDYGWLSWTPFSYPFNLSWQPAATVPCGLTRAGLPAGLQIVGAMHADAQVLTAARAYETVHPFAPPPVARG